jgi:hypothetical protein
MARAYGSSAHLLKARDRLWPGGERQLHPYAVQPLQPGSEQGLIDDPVLARGAILWRRSRT